MKSGPDTLVLFDVCMRTSTGRYFFLGGGRDAMFIHSSCMQWLHIDVKGSYGNNIDSLRQRTNLSKSWPYRRAVQKKVKETHFSWENLILQTCKISTRYSLILANTKLQILVNLMIFYFSLLFSTLDLKFVIFTQPRIQNISHWYFFGAQIEIIIIYI
jgi:hypothetical protein